MAGEQPIIGPTTGIYDRIEGSDFIFKKGNYDTVYIQVAITGTPTDITFNLVDENLNQLYSPYDTAGNAITSTCSITANEYPNVIQLPANFNSDLSEWTDFDAGIYNWNLYWAGNSIYNAVTLPLTIEIRDFDRTQVLTPEIYPYDDILVKFRTWLDTPIVDENILSNYDITYDTDNEVYIISYQNSRPNTVGTNHIYDSTYNVEYTVKNPFKINFSDNKSREYSTANTSIIIESNEHERTYITSSPAIYINGRQIHNYNSSIQTEYGIAITISGSNFPPGTYECILTSQYKRRDFFDATDTFYITTDNCSIELDVQNSIITSTYTHNSTPIPNANLGLVNTTTNTLLETQTTDSNGQITWQTTPIAANTYKIVAIDINNQYILESNTYTHTSYLFYDDASTDNTSAITISNPNNIGYTFVHDTDAYTLTKSGVNNKFIYLDFLTVNTQVDVVYELDLNITDKNPRNNGYNAVFVLGDDKYANTANGFNMGTWSASKFLRYIDNGTMLQDKTNSGVLSSNTWYHFKAIIKSDYVYGEISSNNSIILSYENNNISPIVVPMCFSIGFMSGASSTQKIKNIKIKQL